MNITKEGDESLLLEINGEKMWMNYTEYLVERGFIEGLNSLTKEQQDHIENKSPKMYAYLKHRSEYK